MSKTIILTGIEGIARKSGTDQHGCQWIEFKVDYFADQEDGECSICGATISEGWTCLDGGGEVCSDHVRILTPETIDAFVDAYLETALWAGQDDDGSSLDANYSIDDITDATLTDARTDCLAFLMANLADVEDDVSRAGCDFFLTRNHHGAGFWDGDWEAEAGKRLTDSAHTWGTWELTPDGKGGLTHHN